MHVHMHIHTYIHTYTYVHAACVHPALRMAHGGCCNLHVPVPVPAHVTLQCMLLTFRLPAKSALRPRHLLERARRRLPAAEGWAADVCIWHEAFEGVWHEGVRHAAETMDREVRAEKPEGYLAMTLPDRDLDGLLG